MVEGKSFRFLELSRTMGVFDTLEGLDGGLATR
jgi:hypothetical protein